jgi:hypothetical protein
LAYHWPTGKWAPLSPGEHELIYVGATQSGYTIDGLDALSGTIDGLPYPVDSRFYAGEGQLLLSGFDTSHRQGFYTGAFLAATIETGDVELSEGFKTLLQELEPMIEGSSVTISLTVKRRNLLHETHTSETAVTVNSNGRCHIRSKARFHRVVANTAANDTWTHGDGVRFSKFKKMGRR